MTQVIRRRKGGWKRGRIDAQKPMKQRERKRLCVIVRCDKFVVNEEGTLCERHEDFTQEQILKYSK